MDPDIEEQVISILDNVNDMTVATIRKDGFPQATTVSYVNDGLKLYFITTSDSQKTRNISRNNKVSLTVDRAYDTWEEIESLSMGALAEQVTGEDEQKKINSLFAEKFPQIVDYDSMDDTTLCYFRINPVVISLLDYKKGFGNTEQVYI